MQFANFTYAGLLALTLAVPLALSFDKKVHFYTSWKYLFPAIILTAVVFLTWDIKFTEADIWHFNPDYNLGIIVKGLPIEEWLFFLVVPYACVFIYEVIKAYWPDFQKDNLFAGISLALIVLFAVLSYFNRSHLYTFFNFLFLTVYFAYTIFRNKFKQHLTKFYLAYLTGVVPFLLINGILTSLPVVQYNPEHIIGIRLFTIPLEDFGYFFLLLLMNVTIYETLKERKYY